MTDLTISQQSKLPELSQNTVDELTRLRESNKEEFFWLVHSLIDKKWPLRAIATPLGVSRSAVAIWEKQSMKTGHPFAEELPKSLPKQIKSVYNKYEISPEDKKQLKKLAGPASKVRRFTPQDSPYRQAAKDLENLLHELESKGASLQQLASACGVTRRAIAQRLEKPRD